ncbi:hypothetical protein [Litorisediminicola beolgyonensis]|uniref:DUF883 domain-containing protein n=1 Tax=Litorisediminicola beolgyonensis TaxID=1173614 RepID=A0ABW3ZEJ7_9RHOB
MAEAKLKEAEARANQAAGNDVDALADQMAALKADLASLTDMITEIGVRRKDETVEMARDRIERLRREGRERFDDAQRYAHDTQDQVLESIRRQPGTAVGIAVAVGFLIGLVTSRK